MPAPLVAAPVCPAGRPLRLVRSVAVAVVCVLAASTGHVAAGGLMPGAAAAAVFVGSGAVAWLLSTRRVTPGQMVGLLLLCQVAVHLSASGHEMTMSFAMVIGHLLATAVSAAALARGEALVWRVASRLGLRAAASVVVAPLPHRATQVAVVVPRVRHDVRLAYSQALRGPPSRSS